MSNKTHIVCTKTNNKAGVTKNGAILVSVIPAPSSVVRDSQGPYNKYKIINGLLGDGGLDIGVTNQNVNGSVSAKTFYLGASSNFDIYINQLIITIVGSSVNPNKFGALDALINGFDLYLLQEGEREYLIQKTKTGGDMLIQSGMANPFGTPSLPNTIQSFSGSNDALICTFPLGQYVPGGLRIAKGSLNRIEATVNDNLLAVISLTVRVMGYIDND